MDARRFAALAALLLVLPNFAASFRTENSPGRWPKPPNSSAMTWRFSGSVSRCRVGKSHVPSKSTTAPDWAPADKPALLLMVVAHSVGR